MTTTDPSSRVPTTRGPILAVVAHPVIRQRVEQVARSLGGDLLAFRSVSDVAIQGSPWAIVVEVALEGALDAIEALKRDLPTVPVVGVLAGPRPELWHEAERRGADLVVTHGTMRRHLPAMVLNHGRPPRRRVRAGAMKDFEGRLGYLASVGETPHDIDHDIVPGIAPGIAPEIAPEIALYRVGYDIHAVADRCPHAGAVLHEGELEGCIVTCPRHGSQFDVTTGERMRGPSDDPIKTCRTFVEHGDVFVELEGEDGTEVRRAASDEI